MAFVELDLEILASDLSDSEKLLYSLIKSHWNVSQLKDDDGKKIVFLTQTEMCNLLNWERQKTLRIFSSLKAKKLLSAKRTKNAKNAIFFELDSIKNDSIKNDSIKNDSIKNDSSNASKMINSSIYNRENRINDFSIGEIPQYNNSPNRVFGNTPNGVVSKTPNGVVSKTPNGVLHTYAENTTKTTTKITFDAGEKATRDYLYGNRWDNRWLIDSDKPSFVSDKIWADFCAFRRERGQKVTRTQLKAFLNELQKAHNLGVDVNARILECISKGYASPVLELRTNEINAKSKAEGVRQSRQTLKNWAAKKMAAENEIIDGEITNDTTRIQCGF